MPDATQCRGSRDRLRAVSSCVRALSLGAVLVMALGGCASSGPTPLATSLQALWPSDADAKREAAELPYASLVVRLENVQGLLVLGAKAGNNTLWPSAEGTVLSLHDGALHALAGSNQALLGSTYHDTLPWRQASPAHFRLARHWRDAEGFVHRGEAEGMMRCEETPEPISLPLGERRLERCEVALSWASGASTEATWWRDPDSRALWAVRETPWPDGPSLSWQVARHWW